MLAKQTSANVSCSKTFFLVNSVYTNYVLSARVHCRDPGDTMNKVVSSLRRVLNTEILMLS